MKVIDLLNKIADGDFTLNSNIEIIEEPKKIEPIEKVTFSDKESAEMNILFMSKINEIIEFLNNGEV